MVVAEAHGGLGLQGLLGFLVGHHIEAKEEQDEGGGFGVIGTPRSSGTPMVMVI